MTTLVWFRQDLRLADNPALTEAAGAGDIVPVFILEPEDSGAANPMGGASRWWLHHSLAALAADLGGLSVYKGDPLVILPKLAQQTGADTVMWNRCYDPHAVGRDTKVKTRLKAAGLTVKSHKACLLFEPWEIETKTGGPYKVYTPFWRAARAIGAGMPLPRPENISVLYNADADGLEALKLRPEQPNWAKGWDTLWSPGEAGALARLDTFFGRGLENYGELRNRPDRDNVSRLSPHLHFGEISPRQIWAAASHLADREPALTADADKFLSEIVWREFSYHLLYHFPDLPERNWKPAFDAYPWRESADDLAAWQQGRTGYPIVDAGMRELWRTGYMHNRVRMIVASFLVKHLRLHWKHGETWFRDTLVDADLASNAASWQWVAGSGADAAPYFRIFNPFTQSAKFDPDGTYIRQWVPELAKLDTAYIHMPHEAPDPALARAGIRLGETYPAPIIDHAKARAAALAGYEAVKSAGQSAA